MRYLAGFVYLMGEVISEAYGVNSAAGRLRGGRRRRDGGGQTGRLSSGARAV